tara:strand:+ start:38705 stop:39421 length:717 start_codon:yes stop_codon:yes gene_type:complete
MSDADLAGNIYYGYFYFHTDMDQDSGILWPSNLEMKFDISSDLMVGSDGLTTVHGYVWSAEELATEIEKYEQELGYTAGAPYSPLVETTASVIAVAAADYTSAEDTRSLDHGIYYSVLYNIDRDPYGPAAADIAIDSDNDASYEINYAVAEKSELKSMYSQYADGVGWEESIKTAMQDSVNYALSSSLTTANLMNFKKSKAHSIDTSKVSAFENTKKTTESIVASSTMVVASDNGGGY